MTIARLCKVDGCERVGKVVRGMCQLHYVRWMNRGTTEPLAVHFNTRPALTPLQLLERAAARSEELPTGCWVFRGALSEGYGVIGYKRATWRVHQLAYVAMVGDVPAGLELDHLCRERRCWNPAHLEPVTPRVNMHRSHAPTILAHLAGQCLRGHDMTDPKNVYDYPGSARQCAVCVRANARRRYQVAS